jgi:hypothetical protein
MPDERRSCGRTVVGRRGSLLRDQSDVWMARTRNQRHAMRRDAQRRCVNNSTPVSATYMFLGLEEDDGRRLPCLRSYLHSSHRDLGSSAKGTVPPV